MAVIWRKKLAAKRYEVRRAGNSLRLYTDGTFHSQFNSRRPFAGGIWDLLALPALFLSPPPVRVLLLGVGGGAVICQLRHLLPRFDVTGVELDPVHLQIARRFFGLKPSPRLRLIEADAIAWLRAYRGPAFDLIIDDLFVENGGDPFRAVTVDKDWAGELLRCLNPAGALVINFESRRSLRESALFAGNFQKGRSRVVNAYSLSVPGYDNRIAACFLSPVERKTLDQNLAQLGPMARQLKARLRRVL